MVQKEQLTLYGMSLKEFEDLLYLDETSESGLRWRQSVCSTAMKDSVAGCYSQTVKHPCWRLKYGGVPMVLARVLWFMYYKSPPTGVVDHKNGDTKDHSISNLRSVPQRVNAQNREVKAEFGVPGVYLREDKYGNQIFRCQGVYESGVRWSRVFAVKKYGYEKALSMAKKCREVMEDKSNTQSRRVTLGTDI